MKPGVFTCSATSKAHRPTPRAQKRTGLARLTSLVESLPHRPPPLGPIVRRKPPTTTYRALLFPRGTGPRGSPSPPKRSTPSSGAQKRAVLRATRGSRPCKVWCAPITVGFSSGGSPCRSGRGSSPPGPLLEERSQPSTSPLKCFRPVAPAEGYGGRRASGVYGGDDPPI